MSTETLWNPNFLHRQASLHSSDDRPERFLIILNQPFSPELLSRLWASCSWRVCADGGSNRLYDVLGDDEQRKLFLPDLIKGDLDSARPDVLDFYRQHGVSIIKDPDEWTTDLMKCVAELDRIDEARDVILLGGLSGRLDQTVHTLSYLHKQRNAKRKFYVVTDDNAAWVLDNGVHRIQVDHDVFGQTCGLLPVGIESTNLSTKGLKWNLDEAESGFNGLISTSNHLLPEEKEVWVKTSRPIWWTMEIRASGRD